MALTLGSKLGPYEVIKQLGAGGMGEVYHARDTRLDRSVAVKFLPDAFASDPERLSRFEREAKLLASLNHPNVGAIYGLEESNGQRFLVLEFIDGETLAQRIARGILPVREAIEVGEQIASAVEAAHERGIVHRDLKPGNIMLTQTRVVKVLDFGLAKGDELAQESSPQLSATPTRVQTATGKGIILGTAPYMSPEQARGKEVDKRTDVWAFGCILFECLSGRQTFSGETASDVIARILEREPEWGVLSDSIPTRLRDLIRSCLTKDVDERPRDIGDLRRELSAIKTDMSSTTSASSTAINALPSMAVLYFENQASDPESEYFCSGITEDILTDLSKIKGLRVASRNAVTKYRGQPVDIATVAKDLGVDAVLEGSVRRAGDRVRITAQLINGSDGFQLWAERYDRTLQDVFAVQEEIASSITEALRVALTPAESENLVKDRPNDVRAYDLYLKGREEYGKYTSESLDKALELFEQAIAIDPEYALAYAGVADTYGQMLQWEVAESPSEAIRLGLEAADRAISINPQLAEAYKAQALVLRQSGDPVGSRAANIKALEANPRFGPALINLAVDLFDHADLAGAERLIRRAVEIDPQDAFATTWLAWLLSMTQRLQDSIEVAKQVMQISSDSFYVTAAHLLIGSAHLRLGNLAGAERMITEALAADADAANVQCLEAEIAAHSGQMEKARKLVHDLAEKGVLGAGAQICLASAAMRIGEPDLAERIQIRGSTKNEGKCLIRLTPDLRPLADRELLGPPKWDITLIWPLEAPMIDPASFALFREVHIQSGIPKGSALSLL